MEAVPVILEDTGETDVVETEEVVAGHKPGSSEDESISHIQAYS